MELLAAFDGHMRRRGRSASTRRQYAYALQPFVGWLGDREMAECSPADLELFLTHWEAEFQARHGRLPSPATMRGTIGPLRMFFSYLEQAEFLVGRDGSARRNPARSLESPSCHQRPNDFLRPFEDRALLGVDCPPHHQLVVWLLRYTGIRVGEAQALTVADFDLTPAQESLTVRGTKSAASTRTVPLLPQALPLIHEHLAVLRDTFPSMLALPFLTTRNATPVTTHHLWRVVKRVAYDAGVRPIDCTCHTQRQDKHDRGCPRTVSGENRSAVTPHTLRRTFGSDLINRGLRLETVSKLLGHANTTITERAYAQLLAPTIRKELLHAFRATELKLTEGELELSRR